MGGSDSTTAGVTTSQDEWKYVHRCLDLLLLFASSEDKPMKMGICSDENVELLIEMVEVLLMKEFADSSPEE